MLMVTVCPTPVARSQPALGVCLGSPVILDPVADDSPAPEPSPEPRAKRKRVFHTAGLSATAAVLALSIQAGSLGGDDDPPLNQYGDATILDPDATSGDAVEQ